MNAYFNSIYNVLHGSPYTETTTSIYGHYGILYKLPMKLLGGDLIDFILLNTLVGALSFLAAFLALHFIVKNDLLRITGAVALSFPVLAMRSGIYWQLWPHRVLFMCLMLCYMAFCARYKKLNRLSCILGYGIVFLGILWNTESGLFCGAAWAGFWILKSLCRKENKAPYVIRTVFLHISGIILSFLGAWGIVEIYNLANGGTIMGIREFLFPLLQSSYMDDLLRVDLPHLRQCLYEYYCFAFPCLCMGNLPYVVSPWKRQCRVQRIPSRMFCFCSCCTFTWSDYLFCKQSRLP